MKCQIIIHLLCEILPVRVSEILVAFILVGSTAIGQTFSYPNQLKVIEDVESYQQVALKNPASKMVDLRDQIPGIILNLRYATKKNFTGHKLYPSLTTTYMRSAAAKALGAVQKELNAKALGLIVFDAYRPYRVTKKMWNLIRDDRYVADPKKGSGHNRGTSVDLTIVNLKTMQEFNMGTGFDNFSDSAHHTFVALPAEILANRKTLKTIMEKNGFVALETEWWHYSWAKANDFDLLDIRFKTLKKTLKK